VPAASGNTKIGVCQLRTKSRVTVYTKSERVPPYMLVRKVSTIAIVISGRRAHSSELVKLAGQAEDYLSRLRSRQQGLLRRRSGQSVTSCIAKKRQAISAGMLLSGSVPLWRWAPNAGPAPIHV
jgi:hypothetical protein